jgi:hypothetical protein
LYFKIKTKIKDHFTEFEHNFFAGEISANRITQDELGVVAHLHLFQDGHIEGSVLLEYLLETHRAGKNEEVVNLCENISCTLLHSKNMFTWWIVGQEDENIMYKKRGIIRDFFVNN